MSNKHHRKVHSFANFVKKLKNLRLNRDVERRDRFISNQNFRVKRQCAGNPYPLSLSTGKLMRIAIECALIKPYDFKQFASSGLSFFFISTLNHWALRDDLPNLHAWVQRRIWILEDHLNFCSPRAHFFTVQITKIDAVQHNFAAVVFQKTDDTACKSRFSRPTFPHYAKSFAPAYFQRHILDCVHHTIGLTKTKETLAITKCFLHVLNSKYYIGRSRSRWAGDKAWNRRY